MKKKLNWGSGIAIFYGVFFIVLVIFVIFTFYLNWDLVTENYYKEEINYQNHIDKKNRTEKLSQNIFVNIQDETNEIIIVFPEDYKRKRVTGNIHLYRPSNAKLDKNIQLQLNESGIQKISSKNYEKGNWQIKITWIVDEIQYYYEKQLIL